jgi:hypothetical protein
MPGMRWHGCCGCGAWGAAGYPWYSSREEWARRLEEYQRDLEQEAADVASLISRLKVERSEHVGEV